MDTKKFEGRKREHIQHSLNLANQALGLTGLDQIHLNHEALPEIDFDEIQLKSNCLGQSLKTPFFIAGMTAGHEEAFSINRTLAIACHQRGWAMGVGSQRRDLETSDSLDHWKSLRKEVPKLMLFANIGLSQLIHADLDQIQKIVSKIQADALVIHINALQEALQPEGTPQFRGGLVALKRICKFLDKPVVLKETGCGFAKRTLLQLANVGISAIDVSGLGGTHWGRIEGARAPSDSTHARASVTFANWGEPTAQCVLEAVNALPTTEIWASGGVRSGLDAAKLIALGASRVGYAQPALEAALGGLECLQNWMQLQEFELKIALFCTGSLNCDQLRRKEGIWKLRHI